MSAYYNDNDPFAAQWLRNLIAKGHLPSGEVDERSISEIKSDDLTKFMQCHFFAGIGGWALALQIAKWPLDREIWTGSCPCQPFSNAGKQRGFDDDRHLWPAWRELIRKRRPATVVGEQVASAVEWVGTVRGDLERLRYAFAWLPIEAACAGADQFRDRIYFLADADSDGRTGRRLETSMPGRVDGEASRSSGEGHSFWNESQRIADAFGKKRRFPRNLKPVVDGLSSGVATLRGIGNAIVPQVAAQFISAVMECMP